MVKREQLLGVLFLVLICGCLILGVISIGTLNSEPRNPQSDPGIRIIGIYGFLETPDQEASPAWIGLSASTIAADIRNAQLAPDVKAVILHIDSPGGSVAAIQTLGSAINQLKEKGLIVVAAVDDVATAGAYLLASYADRIVALPGSLIGGFGVYSTVGTKPEMTPALDDLAAQFLTTINANRKGIVTADLLKAGGGLISGRQALDLGLVDGLGGLDEAVKVAVDTAHLETTTSVAPDSFALSRGLLASVVHIAWRPALRYMMAKSPYALQSPMLYFYPGAIQEGDGSGFKRLAPENATEPPVDGEQSQVMPDQDAGPATLDSDVPVTEPEVPAEDQQGSSKSGEANHSTEGK